MGVTDISDNECPIRECGEIGIAVVGNRYAGESPVDIVVKNMCFIGLNVFYADCSFPAIYQVIF